MNSHLDIMRKSYQTHINLLSNVLDEERTRLDLTESQRWSKLSQQCSTNLDLKEKAKMERCQNYNQEIDRIQLKHIEKTRYIQIQLANDYEALQLELEQIKSKCLQNVEKFDYNYQVLQTKTRENVLIRNQEKKRLATLRETLQILREKIRNERKTFFTDNKTIVRDICRFGERIEKLENQADKDAKANDKKVGFVFKYTKPQNSSNTKA